MILSTLRLCTHRVKKHIIEDINRHISKTNYVPKIETNGHKREERKYDIKDNKLFKYNIQQRTMSTTSSTLPSQRASIFLPGDKINDFMAVFPEVVRDLSEDTQDIPEVNHWLAKAFEYTVPTGKRNRAGQLITAYKMIEKPENLSKENMKLAYLLGWCCEMLQASYLIVDDMIDAAETRRNIPCWYKLQDVGVSACNDAIMIGSSLYTILRKYFRNHPSYVPIMELFQTVTLKAAMGQCLDTHSHRQGQKNLEVYTMGRFNAITKYKTYYFMHMPIAMAMYLTGILDSKLHKQVEDIFSGIGHFYQVQNDYLDCYGDPEIIGKEPTDIREGKCTWFSVLAFEKATPKQRNIFKKCYGKDDKKSMETVMNIYEQLDMRNHYNIYEEKSYNLNRTKINQVSDVQLHNMLLNTLDTFYGRQKSTN